MEILSIIAPGLLVTGVILSMIVNVINMLRTHNFLDPFELLASLNKFGKRLFVIAWICGLSGGILMITLGIITEH